MKTSNGFWQTTFHGFKIVADKDVEPGYIEARNDLGQLVGKINTDELLETQTKPIDSTKGE